MVKKYRITYGVVLFVLFAAMVILELWPGLDGLLQEDKHLEYWLQYGLILVSLVAIYAALKLIRKNPLLRISWLMVPAFVNLICYHLFMTSSFGYLAIVCTIAYAFVYPAKEIKETNETKE